MASSAFGALLRRHRLAAGLSQEALAERARMSAEGIGALERGARQSPYRDTVALLANALSLSPTATAELETAAARPRKPRSAVDPTADTTDGSGPTTNLPSARTSLVGRETEIADIARLLRDHRLVTVTAAGGVGKTRISLAVGDALLESMQAGVWLVEFAPLTPGSLVTPAIAQALGVQESPNRPLLETVLAYLRRKSLLLILDNCEHVIAEAAVFADRLLRDCPQLRILATSREALRIAGEHTYRLPSLSVPAQQEAARLGAAEAASYAAVVLFAQRAQAIDQGFVLSDDNAPIVAEICRRLDGIPLAIELTAARVNALSVRALSTMLDQRLRLLTSGDRTAPSRHQTMRALIDWSYDLLSPPEQRLFERLSIFAGGCTLGAAAAVYAAHNARSADGPMEGQASATEPVDELGVLELLTSLIDKSLVIADLGGAEPRYRLLESTRQHGYEKLTVRGEAKLLAHCHALAYTDLAQRLDREDAADLLDTDATWYARVQTEFENWRAALDWALTGRGDIVLGQRLFCALFWAWAYLWPVEGRRWLDAASALVDERTPGILAADLEHTAAGIAFVFGDFETALAASRRALAAYREHGKTMKAVRAEMWVGYSLMSLGRVAEAEQVLQCTIGAARSLERPLLLGSALEGISREPA